MIERPEYWYPTAFSSWEYEEREAIAKVIESGRFTQGVQVEAFESEFAGYHGKRHAIMVNSGSSANLIALSALKLDGRVGIRRAYVPAIAWSTTYAPLIQRGLELIVLDVDRSWNVEMPLPEILPKSVLIACSVLGNPANLPQMAAVAGRAGVPMIEDNCESLGASIRGKLCGTYGLISTASFFWSHQVGAIEGGMVLTDDKDLARWCRILRAHGWTRDVETIAPPFGEEYKFVAFGYNVRALELHAAIARVQLRKLPTLIKARLENENLFRRLTVDVPIECPSEIDETVERSPFGIAFTVADKEARERLVKALREFSVDARMPTGGSFLRHPYAAAWSSPGPFQRKTMVADAIHDTGLFIGNAPWPIYEKIERAVEIMRKVL